ncbi:MAG: ZIP family metal transporter [Patescibacteria group bacterium]
MVSYYALGAVVLVSAVSLLGVMVLFVRENILHKAVFFMVSISAGALFADAFFHLIPESFSALPTQSLTPTLVLLGIIVFFSLEKFLHWHHHHTESEEEEKKDVKIHPVGPMVIVSDVVHNFIDGVIIAASFMASFPLGIATTIAVMLHEIPHEIGNVALLIHAGFTKKRAVVLNCLSAIASILGALLLIVIGKNIEVISYYLLPFAAGGFIYIAGSDLVPELHKDVGLKKALLQLLGIMIGILLIAGLLFLE